MIKLIASDMDGTLLDENGVVPEETYDLIIRLKQAGIRFAVASGRRVPEDIRVIGFNDNYLAACLCPPLTSIRQPIQEMCEMAIECLIKQIHGEKVPVDMVFPVTLSARESTRGPRGKEEKRP